MFALAALTRPEGVVVFGFTLGMVALRRSFHADDLWRCLRWLAAFAAIYLPYYAWRWWYFGYPFPNTYYAKTGSGLAQFYRGLLDLGDFAATYHGIVFLGALVVLARRGASFRSFYLSGLVLGLVGISIYEGGDWIPFFRLLVPALPVYYLVVQEAVVLGSREARKLGSCRGEACLAPTGDQAAHRVPDYLVFAVFVALLVATAWPTPGLRQHTERRATEYAIAHDALGQWLKQSGEGPVALMDIGRIGYRSGLPIVDTSGLTDLHIAHSPGGLIDKRYDLGYVLERSPQYVVLASTTDFVGTGTLPTDFPIESRIYADPRFRRAYRYLFTLGTSWDDTGKGYFLAVFARQGE